MKNLVLASIAAVLVVAYLITNMASVTRSSQQKRAAEALNSLAYDRIQAAMQGFARDRAASNSVMPRTVAAQELVTGGYLSVEEGRAVSAVPVVFYPGYDPAYPPMIIASVRLPEKLVLARLADGSTMLLSESNVWAQITPAASRSQPGRAETNRASAAGPHH